MATLCPSVLNQGFCLDSLCQNQHDTSNFCMICSRVFNTADEYNSHIQTPAHTQAQAQSLSQWVKCVPCERYYIQGTIHQASHQNSDRHIKRLANFQANNTTPAVIPASPPNHIRCEACNLTLLPAPYEQHCRGNRHIRRQRVYDYRNALLRTQANQRGVEVSGPQDSLDLGTHPPTPAPPNVPPVTLQISYTGEDPTGVSLMHARTSASVGAQPGGQLRFTVTAAELPLPITSNFGTEVQIHFNPHGQRGRFEDRLELVFRQSDGSRFVITRPLKAIVGSQDLATLAPTEPYRPPRRARGRGAETKVIETDTWNDPDVQLPVTVTYSRGRRLPKSSIPDGMQRLLDQGSIEEKIQAFRARYMPETLNYASYQQHWSNLVHAEHVQANIDLSNFDMDDVNLTRVGRRHQLAVPGLAEKRPSVLPGDRIKVHPHSAQDGVWFQGIVLQVEALSVFIKFHSSFPQGPTVLCDVQFVLNPIPFRRMLQALNINPKRSNILFPQPNEMPDVNTTQDLDDHGLELYNHLVNNNAEQLQAVKRVIELPPSSPPFVVFGPPGTGKTVTIVECISQLLNNPDNRILACAPSNSACDLIAERLINIRGLQNNELFRLNAVWRPFVTLPADLHEYSLHNNGSFKVPPVAKLTSYRVIVATCSSAALLYGVGVDPGTYTHIFVDEAGQGSEPEVMIPILTMAGGSKANIVLSGDPRQLGPVIQSPVARPVGMGISYLDRLMAMPAYDEQSMRGISVAKLLQNFRSHSSILSFPNEEFYGGELIAHAPQNIANSLVNWNGLVTQNFPVIFRAVEGEDMREGKSPSYFNPHEASIVKEYVQGLLPFIASPANIGIVTPYKGQVRKIRELLASSNISTTGPAGITIGSVEQFQGQERQVIILSTVRSTRELLSYDMRHTLGFVANERRLNVAITRAQSLLIIVGDPRVLGLDTLWRRFLYFIHGSGGWTGASFPWNPDADPDDAAAFSEQPEQELVDLLRRTTLNGANDDVDELDHVGNPDA